MISAEEAKRILVEGNKKYLHARINEGDISPEIRKKTLAEGQRPLAIILCCSDARVIPEAIFSLGIGDIFVIRVAGNVVDRHQLGSIEYAAEHLGGKLVVVLGHDHCGAIEAAIHHDPDGHIGYLVNDILESIGDEQDEYKATCMNAMHCAKIIREDPDMKYLEDKGLEVVSAVYHLEDGRVEFLEKLKSEI